MLTHVFTKQDSCVSIFHFTVYQTAPPRLIGVFDVQVCISDTSHSYIGQLSFFSFLLGFFYSQFLFSFGYWESPT